MNKTLDRLARYAPDGWGQMIRFQIGDVWDEEPVHVYIREQDVVALVAERDAEITRLRALVDAVGENVCKTALRMKTRHGV